MKYLILPLLALLFSSFSVKPDDVELVVVICSHNNDQYVEKNLTSLFSQTYPKWKMIYINDASTDKTAQEVERVIYTHKMQNRSVVIHNRTRQGAMANLYHAINAIPPRKVVVQLDGDDWLKHKKVLARIAEIYRDKNVWMSYGNYESYPQNAFKDSCHPFPAEVMQNASFRDYIWVAYPLRTFYAKLFQNIKADDLKYKGQFFPVVSDTGMMHPMFEMASQGHIYYEKEVLYVYRVNTGSNDFSVRKPLMDEVSAYIKALPKYPPLKQLF